MWSGYLVEESPCALYAVVLYCVVNRLSTLWGLQVQVTGMLQKQSDTGDRVRPDSELYNLIGIAELRVFKSTS